MATTSSVIRKRYDRLAPYFDGLEAIVEGLFFSRWRQKLWQNADGYHILEVGVGTGKNFDFYPKNARITAIDFSAEMIKRALKKKHRKQIAVDLEIMDIQSLDYADNSFDTIIGSFVFCSVPLPHKGLKELYRVCKPGGKVMLLEHVLSSNRVMRRLMNFLNPLVVRLVGANINRETIKSVRGCGFSSVRIDEHSSDIIKLIEATK